MTIVALANVLLDHQAQHWGMANPYLEAVQSLMHERAPRHLAVLNAPPARLSAQTLLRRATSLVQTHTPGTQAIEPTQLLSNGRYNVTLRPNGAGRSRWGQTGLTRWRDDALRDDCGSFIYLQLAPGQSPVSVTQHPAPDPNATYESVFQMDRVSFTARWPGLSVRTTVWVSPEDDIELRRVVITNLGEHTLDVDVLSAFEVTLTTQAADEAHPAFSNLFVQAQWLAHQQALVFERTPRLATERHVQAAHFVAETRGEVRQLRCQTDRQHWLGRNHAASGPLATMIDAPKQSGPLSTGLDPVSVLSVGLSVPAGGQCMVTFAMAAADDSPTLHAVVDKYRQPSSVERASLMSATLAGIQSRPHHLGPDFAPALQALTTALVFTLAHMPASGPRQVATPEATVPVCDRRLLWPLALSGDRPILLVNIGAVQGLGLLRSVMHALHEWSRCVLPCDVVVLSAEPSSYLMPLQRELVALREQHQADQRSFPAGTVTTLHLHRAADLSHDQRCTLDSLARVRLQADGRPLHHHVRVWTDLHNAARQGLAKGTRSWLNAMPAHPVADRHSTAATAITGQFQEPSGDFSFDVEATRRPTRPWANVLANPGFGTLVTEAGGGNTWALNSRLNQLTPWSNDPVADPPSEWFWLQDRRTQTVWSLMPSAWGDASLAYHVSHGQGHTTISHRRGALAVTVVWCVDAHTAIKQVRVSLTNHGTSRQHLRLVGMAEWQMGEQRGHRATTLTACNVSSRGNTQTTTLLCTQAEQSGGFGQGTAFLAMPVVNAAVPSDPDGPDWTCDRRELFDAEGKPVLPQRLGQHSGWGLDPCAALARRLTLMPGQRLDQVFVLGYAATPAAATELALSATQVRPTEREHTVQATWHTLLGTCQVSTPDPLFDAMVNHWLLYQTVSSRLWAKAGFYQAGGATGFRDQLQDAMALSWAAPDVLRAQIVLAASRQFEAGDVQHWWHSPGGAGVRTHFSDDLLWLPFACDHHQRSTGDASLLDEMVPFLEGPEIPDGAEDSYHTPTISSTSATVYEHAARALDHSLATGRHGLPLMGTGDWNDGMNRVGHEGQGESVWLAWFLCAMTPQWIALAQSRHDDARAQRWQTALAGPAWDGEWYKRAFFDDGSPLGSHTNAEAQIDLLAQAWGVLSGAAPLARQHQAMAAVETHLVNADAGLIQLLTPPLAHSSPSPGYIQAYPPGVRENGGQYAHAGVWALMAAAQLARGTPADSAARDTPYRYFSDLSPAHRAAHPTRAAAYGLEPYAMAGDVYSQPPWVGRGGWSWYTGAAGWLHRAAIESLFGLDLQAHTLCLRPCLPTTWQRADLTLMRQGRRMHFTLLRTSAQDALPTLGHAARLLLPGQSVAWDRLNADTDFVVPLLATEPAPNGTPDA
jgi:cyclic beta-1,2-glucan synthetase